MRRARALSFGSVADAYERFRPGYPDELVDAVLAHTHRTVCTALEIGAGTGKATRAFTRRGIDVTATDPDGAMLRELRRHVPTQTATVQAAFEDLPLTSTYDLVFAAASLHWTEPAHRWSRVAALLEPDGTFASFGGAMGLADPDLGESVRAARSADLADDDVPSPDGTSSDGAMQWPGTELLESGLFTEVRQSIIDRRMTIPASEYLGYLSTVSAYLQLPTAVRTEVFHRILDVLPGSVTVAADLTLHVARVRSRPVRHGPTSSYG